MVRVSAVLGVLLCVIVSSGVTAFPGDTNTSALDFIMEAREAGAMISLYKTIEDCSTAFFGEQGINIGRCSGRFQECLCIPPEYEVKFTDTGILVSIPGDRDTKSKGTGTLFLPKESLHFARALYLYPEDSVGEPKMTELFVWLK